MITYPNVKINLGLRVLEKRPDGFHNLETLFIPCMGLSDVLEIEESSSFSIDIDHCSWDPMTDLTVRAYQLLQSDFHIPPVAIRLRKRSPVGAGLGGGSSDAAFALKMLDSIFGLELPDDALASYAARLGSDCAFFIYNRPMIGSGRGDILEDYPMDLDDYRIEIRIPEGVSVSTADAYRGIVPYKEGFAVREALSRPVSEWRDCLINDFEKTVFAKYPYIAQVKQSLYDDGAVYASMSGSGSSVFGIFKTS